MYWVIVWVGKPNNGLCSGLAGVELWGKPWGRSQPGKKVREQCGRKVLGHPRWVVGGAGLEGCSLEPNAMPLGANNNTNGGPIL